MSMRAPGAGTGRLAPGNASDNYAQSGAVWPIIGDRGRAHVHAAQSIAFEIPMYVIDVTYTAPLERIDDALDAHRAFLAKYFEAGVFVAAGPKLPRDGGIILAIRIERDRLDAILATDPFVVQKLAHYEVTEFKTTRLAPGLNLPIPV
jgi:uncharacterized protein YciI